jgi:acetylornithine deacetylase
VSGHGTVLELAQRLVAEPSVNPTLEAGGAGEAAIARLVAGWLAGWGFAVELIDEPPGRPSVVARIGHGRRRLLLNGHLDTVGVAGMTVDPFGGEVRDGRLQGRGACDMKGGIAALLWAAREAARVGVQGELIVALVADEEHASLGMQAVLARGVTADAAIVCEPTGLAIMPAHKGFAWVDVVFEGVAVHGSRPDRGVDAIRHAGHFLARLGELEAELETRPPHPLLGRGSLHAGTIAGGSAPSVYPDRCELVLERRLLPDERGSAALAEVTALLRRVEAAVPGFRATATAGLSRPGTEVAGDHPLVAGLAAALRQAGREPRIEGMTAWVDAALLNEAGIPAVCFGPGSIEDAHAAAEFVPVAELETAAAVLHRFASSFLGEDSP